MSTIKFIELRQDRRLIKSNFDGYKLSLDPIPTIKYELTTPPLHAKPSEDQFSFLHVELFTMHNHLVQDPWDTLSVYFINAQGSILKCTYCLNTGRPKPPSAVYKLPGISARKPGDYHVSFKFISEEFCLLCNGCNQILLINTGDRSRTAEWKVVFKSEVSSDGETQNFVIREARLDLFGSEKRISFILHCIEGRKKEKDEGFIAVLRWYTMTQSDGKTWTLEHKETFHGKGSIHYCALEPESSAMILSSNKPIKALSVVEEEVVAGNGKVEESPDIPFESNYSWSQTDEDVTITFPSPADAVKQDYTVTCEKDKLKIVCKDKALVDSALFNAVDPNLTTWNYENNFFHVTLVKEISSLPWAYLVPGGPQESVETQKDCDVPLGPPIANLEAQMEECDEPTQSLEEENYIDRIDLSTHKATHRILLGSRPPLFSTCLRPGFPSAIATRQDVDACLWLLELNPTIPEEWSLRHEGTLHAFGYVEASKQQKKFTSCSPDMNYAVICESYRHVFLYKSIYETANSLRNRSGPQVTIGKQHLVTLDDAGEVLGMAVDNCVTIILTEKFVMHLQINVD